MQVHHGDPTDLAGWAYVGVFNGGKARFGGLTPGQVVWVRVRTLGTRSVTSLWSDPARIMVL